MLPIKKDGNFHFCIDFRKLHAKSRFDTYPMLTIQEILESMNWASVFITLDHKSGYWQIQLDPDSREITAFSTPLGLFYFRVMPFGLINAAATLVMERVLVKLKVMICFVYIDNIVIYSKTVQQHFQKIQNVLSALQEANLTLNIKNEGHVGFTLTQINPGYC